MMSKLVQASLVLAIAMQAATAQQVQVISNGKPVALADPANGARPRIKDERRARRPLSERPDALAIARAHAAATIKCGLDEAGYPAEQPPSPEELAYFAAHTSFLPVAGSNDILLVGEFLRGKAVFDPEHGAVHTPQCPAGVGAMYWSAAGNRVMFTSQPVMRVDFPGGSRALWVARFGKTQDVWHYSSGAGTRFQKLLTLPNEKVIDMYVPDSGDSVWIISQTEKMDLRTPRTWLRAASGTPAKKMDIFLRHIDGRGHIVSQVTVATGVPAGFAHFVRE